MIPTASHPALAAARPRRTFPVGLRPRGSPAAPEAVSPPGAARRGGTKVWS